MPATRQVLLAQLGDAMQAYQRATQAFDDEVGRQLGVNSADVRCLDWLVDRPRTAGELSAATGLSTAATTAMIDRLERKDFVRRVRSDDDRRKVLVEMTEHGRERTGAFYGPLVLEGLPLLDRYSTVELQAMLRHLVAIREMTERHRDRVRGQRSS